MYDFLFGRIERYCPIAEVGFEFPREQISKGLISKQDIVNEVRRRKRIGDLPPVYPNGWFSLIQSDELVAGASTSVNALGQNFALFRDEEGKVHILDAYCVHLGANLAVGGKVVMCVMWCMCACGADDLGCETCTVDCIWQAFAYIYMIDFMSRFMHRS